MPQPRYMLDTNTASYIIKGKPAAVRQHLLQVPIASLCVSVITEAELLRGVAKKPEARQLPMLVREFLLRVDILPWDSDAAAAYARLASACERTGKLLGAMDMLIAAHAMATESVLVTNDQAFHMHRQKLKLEDWTRPVNA